MNAPPLFTPARAWPLAAALLLCACQPATAPSAGAASADAKPSTLPAFADDKALSAVFARRRASAQADIGSAVGPDESVSAPDLPMAAEAPAPMPMEAAPAAASDAITNVQTAGVDEGDIVKKQGDRLIVLRRGRLFSLDIGGDGLRAVSSVNAFAPGSDPDGTWYDEMLVADGQVVVIGYSYARGGTEIGLFDLGADGGLRYRATYHLRSNDYYSASNYASRLIGKQLIFYSPMSVGGYDEQHPEASLPALRRWHAGAKPEEFERLLPAQRIYYGPESLDAQDPTLHTVTVCDLGGARMQCRSSAALGEANRSFYVGPDAVYVWTLRAQYEMPARGARPLATVFRMPLDGSAPSALRANGAPIDQMSFLERDGWLNVLVASGGHGDGMWDSQAPAGDLALLRVRLGEFGDGQGIAAGSAYRALPEARGQAGALHARYIGDWLVFGFGDGYWGNDPAQRPRGAYALRYAERGPVAVLPLPHTIERVDALGDHAIAIGPTLPPPAKQVSLPEPLPAPPATSTNADTVAVTPPAVPLEDISIPPLPPMPGPAVETDLHFTTLRLGADARIAGEYLLPNAAQADQRSHGFFYRRDDVDRGTLGLPILGSDARGRTNARVLYLHNRHLALSPAGALASKSPAGSDEDDGCVASCVDWYGNARPIFVGDRVFALLGYELVEGRSDGGRIVERRRVDFTPRVAVAR